MIFIEDKDKRHKYMCEHLRMLIAFQVRLLRLQREWTQEQLAEKCETDQPAIARIEDWNKPCPTIAVLKKLAEVFDCALIVRFDGWEEVIKSLVSPYAEDEQMQVSS